MKIREPEESEIAKVIEFYKNVALSPEEIEDKKGEFEKEIKSAFGHDHMLIAIEGDEIVGFLRSQVLQKKDKKRVDTVILLLVSTEKYGEGIGGKLIEKEREWAKEKGVDMLDIEVR